ncbi:MAG: hypothetical protein LBI68_00445 [Azoarcus sp.]|nr:hypothetical protein [Azoarcus sp.]
MKNAISILCAVALTACASTPTAKSSNAPKCQTGTATINNQSISTSFCIQTAAFKPSQYLVQVNGQTVFRGTDFARVAFEKQIKEGKVTGGCDENILLITEHKMDRPIAFTALPAELTAGCHISADSNGNSLPFKKDAACDEVFYKHLGPMLGSVSPVALGKRCTVHIDGKVILDSPF